MASHDGIARAISAPVPGGISSLGPRVRARRSTNRGAAGPVVASASGRVEPVPGRQTEDLRNSDAQQGQAHEQRQRSQVIVGAQGSAWGACYVSAIQVGDALELANALRAVERLAHSPLLGARENHHVIPAWQQRKALRGGQTCLQRASVCGARHYASENKRGNGQNPHRDHEAAADSTRWEGAWAARVWGRRTGQVSIAGPWVHGPGAWQCDARRAHGRACKRAREPLARARRAHAAEHAQLRAALRLALALSRESVHAIAQVWRLLLGRSREGECGAELAARNLPLLQVRPALGSARPDRGARTLWACPTA